jgi:hypothetical protein
MPAMKSFHALADICGVQKYAYLMLSIPFDPDYQGVEELSVIVPSTKSGRPKDLPLPFLMPKKTVHTICSIRRNL